MTAITRPGRWISVVLIVLGSLGALFAVGGGVVRGIAAHGPTSGTWTAEADGLEAVRIASSAARVEVVFGDVDEATLAVEATGGPVQEWTLERDGGTLVVTDPDRWGWLDRGVGPRLGGRDGDGFGPFGGGFGGWRDRGADQHAVLTLPAALEREALDLDADVSAGSLEASGAWGEVALALQAGAADLGGSAESLQVDVSAGEARLDLAVAGAATIEASAGRVVGALTGPQPGSISATASAGSIELRVPDGDYAVTEDVSAGRARILVDEDPAADATIDVEVSAGSVVIRSGR